MKNQIIAIVSVLAFKVYVLMFVSLLPVKAYMLKNEKATQKGYTFTLLTLYFEQILIIKPECQNIRNLALPQLNTLQPSLMQTIIPVLFLHA